MEGEAWRGLGAWALSRDYLRFSGWMSEGRVRS